MNSFTVRLTVRFALLVTATVAAVLTLGGLLLARQSLRAVDLAHEAEGRELAELLDQGAGQSTVQLRERIERDADSDDALYFLQVNNREGGVLFRSANLGAAILPPGSGPAAHSDLNLPTLGDVRLSTFRHGPWQILVASFLEPSRRVLRGYVEVSAALLVGAALASIALGYGFSRLTLRPIQAIEVTARRIGAGGHHERIPVPPGCDELTALTVLLNHTFDRLQESFEQVNRFTADASHELKTPLALVRLNAEKLRAQPGLGADAAETIDDLLEEISHLQHVIDRLLFLARAGSGAMTLDLRSFDTAGFIAEFAPDAAALAEDRGMRFVLGRNEPGRTQAEPALLRQLLLNLLSNAVSAGAPGTPVMLDSFLAGDRWCLVVTDEGPGLPPDRLEKIFDRFVRYAAAPGAGNPGQGLGLSICRSIATLHSGTIRAENRPDRTGLRLMVELPVVPAHAV